MTTRALAVLAILAALPAGAQRIIPRITPRPGLEGTTETSKQPEPIARALMIQRSRVEIESYPILNFTQAAVVSPGLVTGGGTSIGDGVHVQYRGTNTLLASFDFATAYSNATSSSSVEIGARYRPSDFAERFRPYVDVRGVWLVSDNQFNANSSPNGQLVSPLILGARQNSSGFGTLAGVGGEYWFATRFALTSGVEAIRTRMRMYESSASTVPGGQSFWMNNYRVTLGLKFNQARAMQLQ